ncbi:hypothetical protein AWV79_03300 [Cupriavidus sp. UYMMa02A]|nr:hypothetical protein AWV79_03300 [Cupriavidus sp. UYMMa02A]
MARVAMLHSTSGGSSDTELNELAVMPMNGGAPAATDASLARVVMTVTPVANCDSVRRKCSVSKSGDAACPDSRAGTSGMRIARAPLAVMMAS